MNELEKASKFNKIKGNAFKFILRNSADLSNF